VPGKGIPAACLVVPVVRAGQLVFSAYRPS